MTVVRVAEIIGLVVMAIFGSAGFWAWMTSRSDKRKIYDAAYRAGVDASSVLDKRAVSLLDPYVQQVQYLTGELEASRKESQAAREESRLARTETSSLRGELATAMKRISDLENILTRHGLVIEGR